MNRNFRHIIPLALICFLSACSLTKYVPKGDALYTGATIKIEDSTLTSKEKKTIRKRTEDLPRPRPNNKFLGIPFKLILYNMGGDPEKGGFIRNFFHKIGQPPVLLSQLNLDYNVKLLQNYLQNTGYFHATASGDTTIKNKKAKAHYVLTPGPQYTISEVEYDLDSSSAVGHEISNTYNESLLKKGNPFDLEVIKGERSRIDAHLKSKGYYYFSPDFLILNADSTVGHHHVDMHLLVKENTPKQALKPYIIDNVFIYPNYHLAGSARDTGHLQSNLVKGYYIIDPKKKFKPRLFSNIMVFDSGDVYNLRDHNVSLSRLINLDVFKFVKNRFELSPNNESDTGRLNAYYYLTPKAKKSLRIELTGNTKSNNFVGTGVTITFRNRNTFKAAEHLDVYVNAGSEVQYSGYQQGYNTYKLGAGVKFSFPKFVVPFFHFNTSNAFVPKTVIDLNYEILNRRKLYTLNSFKGELGYNWKPNFLVEQELNPVSINYVKAIKITDKYLDSLKDDPLLKYAVDTQFILGSNYSYSINHMIKNPKGSGIYFNAIGDLSGNLAGLVTAPARNGKKKLFGSAFAQYLKTQLDFRYYWALSNGVQWVNRAVTGIGYPYGNSRQLPFIKQFFTGGNNSIRAFRSRSVGPGTFRDKRADSSGFFPDQGGDIKLEFNSEFRFKVNNILEPAVFIDAGNIWLVNKDTNRIGGRFSKEFLKELAVGAGAGLRLNLTILILRLDVAIPLRKPWLPEGERWVFDKIDFSSKDWRRKNIVINLAIGYPF